MKHEYSKLAREPILKQYGYVCKWKRFANVLVIVSSQAYNHTTRLKCKSTLANPEMEISHYIIYHYHFRLHHAVTPYNCIMCERETNLLDWHWASLIMFHMQFATQIRHVWFPKFCILPTLILFMRNKWSIWWYILMFIFQGTTTYRLYSDIPTLRSWLVIILATQLDGQVKVKYIIATFYQTKRYMCFVSDVFI